MKGLGEWFAGTRIGRSVFYLSAFLLAALCIYAITREEVQRQTSSIVKRIEVVEQVEPIDVIRECLRTPNCLKLLQDQERFRPSSKSRGGDAPQPAQAGQKPKPGDEPGGKQGEGKQQAGGDHTGPKRKPPKSRPPADQPVPPTPEAAPSSPPAESPEPGNSGGGESAGQGVKACVDLVVSACVDAGLGNGR